MFKTQKLKVGKTRAFSPVYTLGLYDSSILDAYSLTPDLTLRLDELQQSEQTDFQLAKKVFDLIATQVTYGCEKKTTGYASAKEVWRNKEGICGEMAYLYVASSRYVGLRSSYVSVRRDNSGEKVHHACAAVWIPDQCLVDVAYETFGIKHQTYKLLSDRDVMRNFANWRKVD